MILRFVLGQIHLSTCHKKRSLCIDFDGVQAELFRPRLSITRSASPLRSRPWSTKIDVNWSPIAFCKGTPTTLESTPPEVQARLFFCLFTDFFYCISIKLSIVQLPSQWRTSEAKWRNNSIPYSE